MIELKTAFHWHCENCAADNFSLPQKAELTDAEAEEAYRAFHDLDEWCELPEDWRNFEVVQLPKTVKCSNCGAEFGATGESFSVWDEDE